MMSTHDGCPASHKVYRLSLKKNVGRKRRNFIFDKDSLTKELGPGNKDWFDDATSRKILEKKQQDKVHTCTPGGLLPLCFPSPLDSTPCSSIPSSFHHLLSSQKSTPSPQATWTRLSLGQSPYLESDNETSYKMGKAQPSQIQITKSLGVDDSVLSWTGSLATPTEHSPHAIGDLENFPSPVSKQKGLPRVLFSPGPMTPVTDDELGHTLDTTSEDNTDDELMPADNNYSNRKSVGKDAKSSARSLVELGGDGLSKSSVLTYNNNNQFNQKLCSDTQEVQPNVSQKLCSDTQEVQPNVSQKLCSDTLEVRPNVSQKLCSDTQEVQPNVSQKLCSDTLEVQPNVSQKLCSDTQEVQPNVSQKLCSDSQEVQPNVNQKLCSDSQEVQPNVKSTAEQSALKLKDTFSMSLFSQDEDQHTGIMLDNVSVMENEQSKLSTSNEGRKLGVNVALSDFFDPPSRAVGKRRCAPSRGKKRKSADEETLMLDLILKQNDAINSPLQKKFRHAVLTNQNSPSSSGSMKSNTDDNQKLSREQNSDVCLHTEDIDSDSLNKKVDLPISQNNFQMSASKLDYSGIDTSTPINCKKKHKKNLQVENINSWTDGECDNSTPVNTQKKLKSILSSEKKDRSSNKKKQVRFALQTKSSLKRNCRKMSDAEQTFDDEWMDNGGLTDQEDSLFMTSKIPCESSRETSKYNQQTNQSNVKLCNEIDVHEHVTSGEVNAEIRSGKTPEPSTEINDDLFSQVSPSALIDMCEAASSGNTLHVEEENTSNNMTSENLTVPGKNIKGPSTEDNVDKKELVCEEFSTKRETEIICNKTHSASKHLSLKSKVTRFLYPTTKQISTSCPKTVYAFAEQSPNIQLAESVTEVKEYVETAKPSTVEATVNIGKNVSEGQDSVTSQNNHRPRKVEGFESFSSMVDCSTKFKDYLDSVDERIDTRPRNVEENMEMTSRVIDKTEVDFSEQVESVHKLDKCQSKEKQNKDLTHVDEDNRCVAMSTSVTGQLSTNNCVLGYEKKDMSGIGFNTTSGKKIDTSAQALDIGSKLMKDTLTEEDSVNIYDQESLPRKDQGCRDIKMSNLTRSLSEYGESGNTFKNELMMSAGDANNQPVKAEGLCTNFPSNSLMDGTGDKVLWNLHEKESSRGSGTVTVKTGDSSAKQRSCDSVEDINTARGASVTCCIPTNRTEDESTGAQEQYHLATQQAVKSAVNTGEVELKETYEECIPLQVRRAIGSIMKPDDSCGDQVTDAVKVIPGNQFTVATSVALSDDCQVDDNSRVTIPSNFSTKSYDIIEKSGGFKTAGGRSIHISDCRLKKATDLMENIDEKLSKSSFNKTEISCVNLDTLSCDENFTAGVGQFGGFSTAGGQGIQLNKESMKKALSLIAEVDSYACDKSLKKSSVTNNQDDVTLSNSGGFHTISSKTLALKEESLSNLRKFMPGSLDSVDRLEEMTGSKLDEQTFVNSRLHNASKTSVTNSFFKDCNPTTGFSTAGGTNIKLSDESLRKARALVEDCQEQNSVTELPPLEGFDAVMKKVCPQNRGMSPAKKGDHDRGDESFTKANDVFPELDTMKFPVKTSVHGGNSAKQFKPVIPSMKSGVSSNDFKVTNTNKYSANSSHFPPGANIPKGFRPFKPPKITKKSVIVKDQAPSKSNIENSNESKLGVICAEESKIPNHESHTSYLNNQMPDPSDILKIEKTAPDNTCTTTVVRATNLQHPAIMKSKDTNETDLDPTLMNDLFCDDLEPSQKFSPNSGKMVQKTCAIKQMDKDCMKDSDQQTGKDSETPYHPQISQTVAQIHKDFPIKTKSEETSISSTDTSKHNHSSKKNKVPNMETALAKLKFDASNLMDFDDDDPLLKLAMMEDIDDSAYMNFDQKDSNKVEKIGFKGQDKSDIMEGSKANEEKTSDIHCIFSSRDKVRSSAIDESCDDLLNPCKCLDADDFGEVVVTASADVMFQGFKSASGKSVQVSNAAMANAQKCLLNWSKEDLELTINLLEVSPNSKVLSVSKDSSTKDSGIASVDDISLTEKSQKFECHSKHDSDISIEHGNEDMKPDSHNLDTALTCENKNSNRKTDSASQQQTHFALDELLDSQVEFTQADKVENVCFQGPNTHMGMVNVKPTNGQQKEESTHKFYPKEAEKVSVLKNDASFQSASEKPDTVSKNPLQQVKKNTENVATDLSTFQSASGKAVSVSEKALQQARNSMENNITDMTPFQSASGKAVSVSEKALQQARINIENVVTDMSPFQSASGKAVSVSEKALQQAKKSMENNVTDMSLFQSVSGKAVNVSKKALQQARKNMENVVTDMSPFQSASGKAVSVSEKALQQARKHMENVVTDMSPFQSASGKAVSVSEKALQQDRKTMENVVTDMSLFQSASGKAVSVSEKALQQVRKNMENVVTDMSPFQSASGKSIIVSEKALQQARKNMENVVTDMSPFQSASGKAVSDSEKENMENVRDMSPFQSASGKSVSVSEKALEQARENMENVRDMSTFQSASGKAVCVSEKALQQARKDMENLVTDMSPFQSASGKAVSVSEKALQQARKHMENVVTDMTPFQSASGKAVSVSEKALQQARKHVENVVTDMSPFQSASGKAVIVSEKALQQARKSMENVVTDMSPFQSASGKAVSVSEKALQQARKHMENVVTDMSPFQSASGKSVSVSEKALLQARKNMENVVTDMSPFQSASGKAVSDSEKALQQARENMENVRDMSPFQSASGKAVSVSEKALQQARKNMENVVTDMSPFQSASGKAVSVSEKALQQARKNMEHVKTDPTISKKVEGNVISVSDKVQENIGGIAMERPPINFDSDFQYYTNEAPNAQESNLIETVVNRKFILDKSGHRLLSAPQDYVNSKSSGYMQTEITNKLNSKDRIVRGFNLIDRTVVGGCDQDLEIFYQPDDFLEEMEIPPKKRKLDGQLQMKNAVTPGEQGFLTPVKSIPEVLMKDRHTTSHSLKPLHSHTSQMAREKRQFSEKDENHKQVMTQPVKAVFKTPYRSRNIQNCQTSNVGSIQTSATPTYIPQSFARNKAFLGGTFSTGSEKEKLKKESRTNNVNDTGDATAVDVVAIIQDSRKYQEEMIQKKEKTKVRPKMGRLLEMKSQKCRIKLKDVINLHHKSHSELELLKQGVEKGTLLVKAGNAAKHVFHLPDFYSGFKGHVYVGDGAFLVPDDHLNAGKEEFFRAFLTVEGVDGKLFSKAWFYNHYRWVIWKLASYEIVSPGNFAGRSLNPEMVMLQLKYRYDREIDKCQRSALKKMMERDDTASKRMVLCVSNICQSQTGEKKATPIDKPAAEKQVVNKLDIQSSVELTDGWYSIMAMLDVPLQDLVNNSKIRLGDKLCISGAELVGSQDACSPLEASTDLMLKLNANSTRPVPWDTKLGYQANPCPLCVPLTKLYGEGGTVGCLDVVIARKYPVMFMERLSDGSCVFRSRQAEDQFQHQHEQHTQVEMEKVYNQLQLKFEKEEAAEKCISKKWTKKEVEHLQTGQELYEAYSTSRLPETLEEYLSENQRSMLMEYKQQVQEERCHQLQREFQKTCQSKLERNVVPLLKLRIVGCSRKDLDAKASSFLSVWRPSPNILELKEGGRYKIYGLTATAARSRYCQHDVQLSANRQTRFQNLEVDENLLDMMYEPREVMRVDDVRRRRSVFGEVDFVGIVISVSSVDFAESGKHQDIVYAADSVGDVLGIKFWGGVKNYSFEDLLTEGCIFCGTNLIDKSFHGSDVPVLEVSSELTSLTRKPQYPSQRLAIDKLQAAIKNKKEFTERAKQHLSEKKHMNHTTEKLKTNTVKYGPSVSIPSASSATPEVDGVEISKRSAYQTKMARLLNYGSPSPLSPIPSASSRKVNKAFKSPLVQNSSGHS